MLVICAGMLRSGSTVQRQIVSELIKNRDLGETIQPVNKQQLLDNYAYWAASDKWYVYKIHEYVAMSDAKPGTVKVLTTVRDLYDVTVSLMHFLDKDFEATIHSHEWTSNIPNFLSWLTAYPDIGIQSYFDLWYHLKTEINDVAWYLGIPISESEIDEIAAKVNIKANLRRIVANKPINDPEYMAVRQIYDGEPSHNARQLLPEQIAQLQPLATWWDKFKDKLTYV